MFSRQSEPEEGVFLRGDAVISRKSGAEREILRTSDILLPGVHNVENYLAAISAVDGLVPDEAMEMKIRFISKIIILK